MQACRTISSCRGMYSERPDVKNRCDVRHTHTASRGHRSRTSHRDAALPPPAVLDAGTCFTTDWKLLNDLRRRRVADRCLAPAVRFPADEDQPYGCRFVPEQLLAWDEFRATWCNDQRKEDFSNEQVATTTACSNNSRAHGATMFVLDEWGRHCTGRAPAGHGGCGG